MSRGDLVEDGLVRPCPEVGNFVQPRHVGGDGLVAANEEVVVTDCDVGPPTSLAADLVSKVDKK